MTTPASSRISTVTGRHIDPLDPNPDDIDIYDIAHALARQCRYNGHVGHFLSVARHSIWVSEQLAGHGKAMQLWGLLHDASEAYLGDLVKPIKVQPQMKVFVDAEEQLEWAIAKRFGLCYPMPEEVHEADRVVTIQHEINDKRWMHNTTYNVDEDAFLALFDELYDENAVDQFATGGVVPRPSDTNPAIGLKDQQSATVIAATVPISKQLLEDNPKVVFSDPPKIGEYVTKDSGARVEYDSGMRRDTNEGKPRYDLIPIKPLRRLAELYARGAVKYGDRNWQLANSQEELERFKASGLRHMFQWLNGEDDEDHAIATVWNIFAVLFVEDKLKDEDVVGKLFDTLVAQRQRVHEEAAKHNAQRDALSARALSRVDL
jgi:5'-deoxynucleotidase YfbR-like HD superfamily hydrolase